MKSRDLVITRVFDAPCDLVYACWTEPEHLARWGGAPEGLDVDVEHQDIRVGGTFRVRMHSPDGVDVRLQGTYRELEKPTRLAFTHAWLPEDGSTPRETLVTIDLKPAGTRSEKTELTLRHAGLGSPDSRAGHEEGWNSTFDRLAAFLSGYRA